MTNPPEQRRRSFPQPRRIHIDLGLRGYDVLIGRNLLEHGDSLTTTYASDLEFPVAIVTDDKVNASLFVSNLMAENLVGTLMSLNGEIKRRLTEDGEVKESMDEEAIPRLVKQLFSKYVSVIAKVPSGEASKTMSCASKVLSQIAKAKMPRSGTVIGIGGGVVGDLAGFVAATYLRGVNFVQVPTTLLAMVDSSVGGKTGVNLPEGKNLVGAFHQPKLVLADLDVLSKLPSDEFSAGMAEVVKYGAIRDKKLFERVAQPVKPTDADLDVIVETCVAIKARIVENDEFETKGERALLNFGHTIGHAIEKATTFERELALEKARSIVEIPEKEAEIKKAEAMPAYLHGEAISLGMRAAAWLSVWHTGLPEADARRIEAALKANDLPLVLKPEVDRAAILAALGNDKKVAADGKNRWVLLKALGEATSGHELPADLVAKAVDLIYSN